MLFSFSVYRLLKKRSKGASPAYEGEIALLPLDGQGGVGGSAWGQIAFQQLLQYTKSARMACCLPLCLQARRGCARLASICRAESNS